MIEYKVKVTATVTKYYTVLVENAGMTHEEAAQRGRDYGAENLLKSEDGYEVEIDNIDILEYNNI